MTNSEEFGRFQGSIDSSAQATVFTIAYSMPEDQDNQNQIS